LIYYTTSGLSIAAYIFTRLQFWLSFSKHETIRNDTE